MNLHVRVCAKFSQQTWAVAQQLVIANPVALSSSIELNLLYVSYSPTTLDKMLKKLSIKVQFLKIRSRDM
jgi:hypothetical protein